MTWTEERVAELHRLWDTGKSASEIGKILGVSKNSVVGKAHRLKLTARPSLPNLEAYYARMQERPAYREHVMVSYEDLRVTD